jgi:hypothetical protein
LPLTQKILTGQNRAATTFSSIGEKAPPGLDSPAANAPGATAMPSKSASDAKVNLAFDMTNLPLAAEVVF